MASQKDTTPRIVELAAQISKSVTKLQEKLSAQGAATPSFAENGPELLPDDVSSLKDAVLDATAELHEILLDPLLLLFKFASVSLTELRRASSQANDSRSRIWSPLMEYAATRFRI
jgi:hypothetical protein